MALSADDPDMRHRAGQVALAQAVADTLNAPGSQLAAEAPTGTGKTVALLVPAMAVVKSRRAVVSTYSNILATRMAVDELARIKRALDFEG
ncbi:MAG: ATP-dependent helicase, partial [Chloroflexota bacterium]|nr:ATP-dependent helicase [Chloroflexota bacterium]